MDEHLPPDLKDAWLAAFCCAHGAYALLDEMRRFGADKGIDRVAHLYGLALKARPKVRVVSAELDALPLRPLSICGYSASNGHELAVTLAYVLGLVWCDDVVWPAQKTGERYWPMVWPVAPADTEEVWRTVSERLCGFPQFSKSELEVLCAALVKEAATAAANRRKEVAREHAERGQKVLEAAKAGGRAKAEQTRAEQEARSAEYCKAVAELRRKDRGMSKNSIYHAVAKRLMDRGVNVSAETIRYHAERKKTL